MLSETPSYETSLENELYDAEKMLLQKFIITKPETFPPQSAGWQQFWHGYYQMTKVRSAAKTQNDQQAHHVDDLIAEAMSESEFEKQLFLNIIRNIKKDHINMFELGAGRGDWCLSLAGVIDHHLLDTQAKTYRCLALEGEPTHYKWTKEHFDYQHINGVAVHGAVMAMDGYCKFRADSDPADHYGQRVSSCGNITVPCYSIDTLMKDHGFEHLDIIHMDVQNAEYEAMLGAAGAIADRKIDYFLIGTHKAYLNKKIIELVKGNYHCIVDFTPNSPKVDTRIGKASLPVDGIMLLQRVGLKAVNTARSGKQNKSKNDSID